MSSGFLAQDKRFHWLDGKFVKPYIFMRSDLRPQNPGCADLDWFPFEPEIKDPFHMKEGAFSTQILSLENKVFHDAGLAMPRWVFYDCALVPGVTAGFMIHRSKASAQVLEITGAPEDAEWVPLSLFCMIPTVRPGEWVAHNLSSINSALEPGERFYGLGFISKAFALWYANIQTCIGMTQWQSPALKLHSHYGDIEILTSYTPSHTYAETLTYRLKVNVDEFDRFFTHEESTRFEQHYRKEGALLHRQSRESLIQLQARLEAGDGPFFLNAHEVRIQPLDAPLTVFTPLSF